MELNVKESFVKTGMILSRFIKKRTPELLVGFGTAFGITSTVSAVNATAKASGKLEEKKQELGVEELSAKDIVKTVGKGYVPALVSGLIGIGMVTASVAVSNRRYLALAASYELLKDHSETYKDKVVEIFGEKKEDKVEEAIAQDKVNNTPPTDESIVVTGKGNTLFMDSLSGQYFRHDIDKLKRIAVDMANKELNEGYVGISEWFNMIGLNVTDYWGDQGWSLSDQGKVVTISFRAVTAYNYNEEPCHMVEYSLTPVNSYYSYYK